MNETLIAPQPVPIADTATERRLHPLTLLLNLSRQLPQAIIGLIALRLSGPDEIRGWVALIAFFAIVAMFGTEFWKWWRFSYRLGEEELRIASGIISRNVRSIPYERIQDVNLEQGLLARMLGMAKVRLETGSSGSGDEGVLDSVDLAEASRLRDVIRLRKAAQETTEPAAEAAPEFTHAAAETRPMFAMDTRRVLTAGVFNFSLVFFALVGALVNNLDFLLPGDIWDPRRLLDMLGLEDLFAALHRRPSDVDHRCAVQPAGDRAARRRDPHGLARARLPARPHRNRVSQAAGADHAHRCGDAAAPHPGCGHRHWAAAATAGLVRTQGPEPRQRQRQGKRPRHRSAGACR